MTAKANNVGGAEEQTAAVQAQWLARVQQEHDAIQADCLARLLLVRQVFDHLQGQLRSGKFPLNPLGNLQEQANFLDSQIATLGTLRKLLAEDAEARAKRLAADAIWG